MARIHRIYYKGDLVYPLTISDAVLNAETGEPISKVLKEVPINSITAEEINDLVTK